MFRIAVFALGTTLAFAAYAQDPKLYLVDAIATQSDNARARATASELEAIYDELAHAAGVEATLVWSTAADINAFATIAGEEQIVVVQEGLLDKFGGDRDAVAAVLGHELAHHKADHIREGKKKREGMRVFGAILGAVVGAKVGSDSGELAGALAGTAVNVGAGLLVLKFSRNQELEADRLAVGWMIASGYNPNGMLRLQEGLGEMSGKKSNASILSTHPTSKKRYAAAEKQIAKLNPQPELLARSVVPLTDDADLARAEQSIAAAKQAQLATASKTSPREPSAAALVPIEGVDFDTYAAISNQLVRAGTKGRSKVLSRHGLDDAALDRLGTGYSARMQGDAGLRLRYAVAYYRATDGKLAAWGKDLANSYEHDQDLKLEPPYSFEVAKDLILELSARGAPQMDDSQTAVAEKEILAPQGLSYYDFLIGHGWWSRRLKLMALTGNIAPMQEYFGAMNGARLSSASTSTETSGVRIGKNVSIGGKPVTTKSDSPTD